MRKRYSIFFMALTMVASNALYAQQNVTSKFMTNPSFEASTDGWTVTDLQTQTNNSFTKKAGSIYLERWTSKGSAVGSGSAIQTLTGLPAGKYRLTAAAQNIQQDSPSTAQAGASIYAGTTTNATVVTVTADYSVEFETPGTDVHVGFRAVSASGNWICVDNFRLFYLAPDFTLMQTAIENAQAVITAAEKSTMAGIQPGIKANLLKAIENAEALTAESSEDALTEACFELAETQAIASKNAADLKALKTAATKAKTRLVSDMAEAYKEALQKAYDAAQEILSLESDGDVDAVAAQLATAYENANESYTAKKALKTAISAANRVYDEDKEGAEAFAAAIAAAEAVRDKADASPEEMTAATTAIEDATLFFRLENATGDPMNVTTLGVVQGATEIFGRGSFTGGTAREKGFCYSEDPYPTIYDARTTTTYSNNGDIYAMQGLKPATVYYVRAYAISSGYQLSYGDVVKVPTRPLGDVSYDYDYAGDAATNDRIVAACEEAVWMWNNITGIKGFHLSAHYVPGAGAGSGTADCSYGGYMRISQSTSYQRTGTVLHEGSHGQGIISYTDWVNPIYRTNGDRGYWLGPRVDRVIHFLENNVNARLNGDNIHMWPYGINGASEDTGSPILYRANALVVGALAEDAIQTPNMDFQKPAYSFVQDDETKYYIKNEAENRGLATSYLRQKTATGLRFEAMTADEAFANDSAAWYVSFDPATCYYTFTNVATGAYLVMNSGSATASKSPTNATFHLLGSRNTTKLDDFTFEGTSYWIVSSASHNAMNATVTGASSANFNHADEATTQRWLILTPDEVARFAQARGETVGITATPANASAAPLEVVGGKGMMSITANSAAGQVSVCTLDGRLVDRVYVQLGTTANLSLPRGIYVVGGQKVVVR